MRKFIAEFLTEFFMIVWAISVAFALQLPSLSDYMHNRLVIHWNHPTWTGNQYVERMWLSHD